MYFNHARKTQQEPEGVTVRERVRRFALDVLFPLFALVGFLVCVVGTVWAIYVFYVGKGE